MRLLLAGIAAIAFAAATAQPASAQPDLKHPVCMIGGYYDAGDWDCMYYNMWQCRQAASGLGGWCVTNPWYQGPRTRGKRTRGPRDWGWGWGAE